LNSAKRRKKKRNVGQTKTFGSRVNGIPSTRQALRMSLESFYMKQSLNPSRGEKQEDEGIKDKQMIISLHARKSKMKTLNSKAE
jgi:hypothetical protein